MLFIIYAWTTFSLSRRLLLKLCRHWRNLLNLQLQHVVNSTANINLWRQTQVTCFYCVYVDMSSIISTGLELCQIACRNKDKRLSIARKASWESSLDINVILRHRYRHEHRILMTAFNWNDKTWDQQLRRLARRLAIVANINKYYFRSLLTAVKYLFSTRVTNIILVVSEHSRHCSRGSAERTSEIL